MIKRTGQRSRQMMGREIRKVPANWEHPKDENGHYRPIYDENYELAINEWFENHMLWLKGKHPDQLTDAPPQYKHYAEWGGNPPEIDYYRHYKDEDCTHFQMYETVSEGTPMSPVFASKELLSKWIAENLGYSEHAANEFVNSGWAPSFTVSNGIIWDGISSFDD